MTLAAAFRWLLPWMRERRAAKPKPAEKPKYQQLDEDGRPIKAPGLIWYDLPDTADEG